MKKYTKYLGIAALFILVCICAFLFSRSSETLSDYAIRQPEIAYKEKEKEPEEKQSDLPENDPNGETADNDKADDQTADGGMADSKATDDKTTDDKVSDSKTDRSEGDTTETVTAKTLGTNGEIPGDSAETKMHLTEDTEEGEEAMNDAMLYPERTIWQPDFYYEPLSEDMKKRITGLSYKEDCPIPYDDLRHVSVLYVNFKGNTSTGDIICNKAIAQDLVEIFYELYQADYQIEQIRLVDEYGADDLLSMQDNNTSCFNYRTIAGTNKISMHGRGLAIDINPFFNPYITYKGGKQQVSPVGAESYADRSRSFAYKIDEDDLCYKLFTQHGFSWGGNWNNSKDYQHFEKKAEN